jgi:hypothetical protein
VVWRLDRLGRSLPNLIEVVAEFERRGVGFKSLGEALDTTTTGGKLVFHIFGALAEFEKNLVRIGHSLGSERLGSVVAPVGAPAVCLMRSSRLPSGSCSCETARRRKM